MDLFSSKDNHVTSTSFGNHDSSKAITTDVVVVGGGGSGLAAAIEAASLGRRVVLLEKEEVPLRRLGVNQACEGLAARDRARKLDALPT